MIYQPLINHGKARVKEEYAKNICTEYDRFTTRNAKVIKFFFFYREYGNKMLENLKIKLNSLCKNLSTKKFSVKATKISNLSGA